MACLSVYATANDYISMACAGTVTAEATAQIEVTLQLVAADINAVLGATGACDCTWASWVSDFLKKLNVIEAMVFHQCPCGRVKLSDAQWSGYLQWVTNVHEQLRSGKLEICQGATAIDVPAFGVAEKAWTEWNAAIILDKLGDES